MDGDKAREDRLFDLLDKNPIKPHPFNSLSDEEKQKYLEQEKLQDK
jgi:hypothetical protein